MKNTEWVPIKNFPDYEINREGKVRRITYKAVRLIRGYYYMDLNKGKKRKNARLNRLVAEAFIPNPSNLPEVNHKDGNKFNNSVENLEWCTSSENLKHAFKIGLRKPMRGELSGQAKITSDDVEAIRLLVNEYGLMRREVAEMFELGVSTITHIALGTRWNHLKLTPPNTPGIS